MTNVLEHVLTCYASPRFIYPQPILSFAKMTAASSRMPEISIKTDGDLLVSIVNDVQ